MKENLKEIKNKAPTQPKKVEKNQCAYECECKQCERCSNCDYTVNGLRRFHWRGDKFLCEKCLWDQQAVEKKPKLITLTGITTSQINQALKADNPYPARVFLKVDNQEQDIPVFFRIKGNQGNYIRPKIKTGSLIKVQGYLSLGTVYTKQSERKSFTAISYTLLSCPHSQKKPYFCPIDCPCLKGKEVLNQQTQQQVLSYDK